MRTLKTLWRLAVDKGLSPKNRTRDGLRVQSGSAAREPRKHVERLLNDEPPTRILQ
jgi:hypothetical protein